MDLSRKGLWLPTFKRVKFQEDYKQGIKKKRRRENISCKVVITKLILTEKTALHSNSIPDG